MLVQVEMPHAGLQVDYSNAGTRISLLSEAIAAGEILLFAPDARELTVNGTFRKFQRRGEFIWIPSSDATKRR